MRSDTDNMDDYRKCAPSRRENHNTRKEKAKRLNLRESIIREMTRYAKQYGAINLSQGAPNECPDFDIVWAGACALLGGTAKGYDLVNNYAVTPDSIKELSDTHKVLLKDICKSLRSSEDAYNQYSIPYGTPEMRLALQRYYHRFYDADLNPETEITVVLGATEGVSVCLRTFASPGDGICIIQPYHEMYVNQSIIFGLVPHFITLEENLTTGEWSLNMNDLHHVLSQPEVKLLILNSPHNPTGRVFTYEELRHVCEMCHRHDVTIITDEIYEHLIYAESEQKHIFLYKEFEKYNKNIVCVNSISKTGCATGWRVGWIICHPDNITGLRAVHDTLAMQAPTPLQIGSIVLLDMPNTFFENMRKLYTQKRDILRKALIEAGFRLSPIYGSYYFFANYSGVDKLKHLNSTECAFTLTATYKVAVVPGVAFYTELPDECKYVRFAFCQSIENLVQAGKNLQKLVA